MREVAGRRSVTCVTMVPDRIISSAIRGVPRGTASGRGPESVAIIGGQVIGAARGAGPGGEREAPDITVNWRKHRGPGDVSFAQDRIPLATKGNPGTILEATTTPTFSAPGEYVVRAQVNDTSGDGGGGDQCCWTTAHVRVMVKLVL